MGGHEGEVLQLPVAALQFLHGFFQLFHGLAQGRGVTGHYVDQVVGTENGVDVDPVDAALPVEDTNLQVFDFRAFAQGPYGFLDRFPVVRMNQVQVGGTQQFIPGVAQGVDEVGVQLEEITVQVDDAEHVG